MDQGFPVIGTIYVVPINLGNLSAIPLSKRPQRYSIIVSLGDFQIKNCYLEKKYTFNIKIKKEYIQE